MIPTKIMLWNRLLCIAAKVSILYQGSTGVFVRKWPTCLLPRRIQIQASLPYTWSGAYPMYRYIGYFLFLIFILSFYSVLYLTFFNIALNEIIVIEILGLCIRFFFWTLDGADCAQFPVLKQKYKNWRIEKEEKRFEQVARIKSVISYYISFFTSQLWWHIQVNLQLKWEGY